MGGLNESCKKAIFNFDYLANVSALLLQKFPLHF